MKKSSFISIYYFSSTKIFLNPLNFYLSSSLFSKELELKKLPFGIIYVKDKHLIIYFYIMPGNFSLLAQRKVAEKESALVRSP
ncbi:hypothetical protein [Megamonas hypermegale]|uniref:hypothetical protein n=1 Tax=Megamonas hypermegale TaxID=158847 RepID=UPI0026F09EC7|nr:hypothetical protein [Megamonas hypermegale]